MSETSDADYQGLIKYRLEQADEALLESQILLDKSLYNGATRCAYYAMFYAVQALMVNSEDFTSKHRGVISFFDRQFIKPASSIVRFQLGCTMFLICDWTQTTGRA